MLDDSLMIYVRLKGGLGNQLFQYAAGYALSRERNQGLVLDISYYNKNNNDYRLDKLGLDDNVLVTDKNRFCIRILHNKFINKGIRIIGVENPYIGKDGLYILESKAETLDSYFKREATNIYLDGYFQTPKYFEKYKYDIQNQFEIKDNLLDGIERELDSIRNSNSVAVHVRRGDFIQAQHDQSGFHYLLNEEYYGRAIDYINRHVEHAVFFCFSNDTEWVKKNWGNRFKFNYINVESADADLLEFELMKNCKHIISANSTFSWWASWLNRNETAIRIVPKKRYGNADMIPTQWIKL